MEDSIRQLLLKPLQGRLTPLFKSNADIFETIVLTPGHVFHVISNDQKEKQQAIARVKARWSSLVSGKRNNPIDADLEKALVSVLDKKLADDYEKQNKIEMIILALRESGRELSPVQAEGNQFRVPRLVTFIPIKSESYLQFLSALKEADTAYCVLDEIMTRYLFTQIETAEISKVFWDTIILEKGPHIRLFMPWEDTTGIWALLREGLKRFLERFLWPLLNNSEGNSIFEIEIERYADHPFIKAFFEKSKIADPEKRREAQGQILDKILAKSNEKGIGPLGRRRLRIVANKLPKMFSTPYVIIDPSLGKPGLYSLCRRPNGLDVFRWENTNIYQWQKYDRAYFLDISSGTNHEQYIKNIAAPIT